jgi:hypothetical protein
LSKSRRLSNGRSPRYIARASTVNTFGAVDLFAKDARIYPWHGQLGRGACTQALAEGQSARA